MISILVEVEDRPGTSAFVRVRTSGFQNGNPIEIDIAGFFREAIIATKDFIAKESGKASEIEVHNRELTLAELEALKTDYYK